MAGVAVEDALELWASSLREVKRRIRPLFTQERVAVSAGLFLDGLLRAGAAQDRLDAGGGGGRPRPLAAAGHPRPRPLGGRCAARSRARLRAGDAGRPGCRAGDRRDRLSQAGQVVLRRRRASTRARPARSPTARSGSSRPTCPGTAMPSSTGHSTCPRPGPTIRPAWRRRMCRPGSPSRPSRVLRCAMIERAIAAGVPFAWVAADSVYGVGEIEMALRRAGKGYVLGRQRRPPLQLLGRQAPGGRHGRGDRPGAARIGVGAPLGRRGHQGSAALRLGLPGAGRPRGRRVRRQPLRPVDAGPA